MKIKKPIEVRIEMTEWELGELHRSLGSVLEMFHKPMLVEDYINLAEFRDLLKEFYAS